MYSKGKSEKKLISELHTIYEDEYIIAIEKPAGLLSIRDGYKPDLPNVHSILQQRAQKIWIVHRLDKETSGVMIFAKNDDAHRKLNLQFEHHLISKIYLTIVWGQFNQINQTVDLPLIINADRKHRTRVTKEYGKVAITHINLIHQYHQFAYISVIPETGYTHQIRAHLSEIGHPILGDILYGNLQKEVKNKVDQDSTIHASRLFLHCHKLIFTHPVFERVIQLQSPVPLEFNELLRKIDKYY